MSERDGEEAIARRARTLLDRSADDLDPVVRARLRAARLRALDALPEPRPRVERRHWIAVGAAVGGLGLLFGVSWWLRPAAGPLSLDDDLEDVEILAGVDDLELYDDLEFYRWLEDSEPI